MRRLGLGLALLALVAGQPARGQDPDAMARLASQITSQASAFWADGAVPTSRGALFRGDLEPARQALEQLAGMGEAAVPALAQLARHRSAHLRANVAWALSRIGGPAVVGPLLDLSDDPSDAVRYQTALALGYTASAQALTALNRLAGDKNNAVRSAGIQTGGELREILAAEEAETADAKFAALVNLTVNDAACRRLIGYGAEAVPALLAALGAEDDGVVAGAAWCLAQIGDPRGMQPLFDKFMATLGATPQLKFAQALADYRNPDVWPYLVKLLETEAVDAVPMAQYYALERMQRLEHADRLKVIHAFLQRMIAKGEHKKESRGPQTEVSTVGAAANALAAIGDASSLPLLETLINEAPAAEKSIVKPLAERAKTAIQARVG